MRRYPGFLPVLWAWFSSLQAKVKDAHISCAGRGKAEQEACFKAGTSRAHWGESAHNYNAAFDLFRLTMGKLSYEVPWFREIIGPKIPKGFTWYGAPGSKFSELPHVELTNWKTLGLPLVDDEKKTS